MRGPVGRRDTSFVVGRQCSLVVGPLVLETFASEGEGLAFPCSVEDGGEGAVASLLQGEAVEVMLLRLVAVVVFEYCDSSQS